MSVKVRFYSYDIEFEFENSVEFPVAPAVGDEVNLISFFKYNKYHSLFPFPNIYKKPFQSKKSNNLTIIPVKTGN